MSERNRFEGKVAVVTGAGSGLGEASALQMASEGAAVVVVDWNRDAAVATVERIRHADGEARPFVGDASEESVAEAMVEDAVQAYGGLDVLHNNVFGTTMGKVVNIPLDKWNKTLALSLTSYFLGTKYGVMAMLDREGGAIVNTASVHGMTGDRRMAPYVTAKHGVVGLTLCTALDYAADGIRANAVCPCTMETPAFKQLFGEGEGTESWLAFDPDPSATPALPTEEDLQALRQAFRNAHPMGDVAQPRDVATVVAFLASDDAPWITGQTVIVDGGLLAPSRTPDFTTMAEASTLHQIAAEA
ncbi:MAG: SDR family NAD(P)-dependent oxidoreductase [Solirubrobacterales bacterium]